MEKRAMPASIKPMPGRAPPAIRAGNSGENFIQSSCNDLDAVHQSRTRRLRNPREARLDLPADEQALREEVPAQASQAARDQELHDLVRAGINPHHPRI